MALLTVAVVGAGASPAAQPDAPTRGLAGRLLVATPGMNDPRFVGTVIYMVRQGDAGALGLVVNRPLAEVPLAKLLAELGLDATGVTGSIRVHYGGPVEQARGLVLHTTDYAGQSTVPVNDSVALTSEPEVLQAIAAGHGPRRSLFSLGYAGWAPGQLEAEIDAGAWVTVPADEALVFDADYAGKWRRAISRRGVDL
jgi:putative transcriptional regulator